MAPERNGGGRMGWRGLLALLALWVVFYGSVTLLTPPLLDDADSVHAEVAREMLLRHDFVTLYANGIRYLEKAPLYYWAMAAAMRVLGATTAAARLPLALSVLGLALLLAEFARRMFASAQAGLHAGLIVLSSFGFFIFSRINLPDVLVCVLLSAAVYVFYRTETLGHSRGWPWSVGFAAACALNILTKGLIGIVFPVAIVGAYLLLTRGLRGALRRIGELRPVLGLAVFLAVAAPWHVLIALANPAQGHPGDVSFDHGHWAVPLPTDGNVHGWAWFYFVNEQVLRYLNLRVPRDYDTVPLGLFLGLIFAWLVPWSAFLPAAVGKAAPVWVRGWRQRFLARTLSADERGKLLLVIWAVLPLGFFAFSTRQEYYVLPALPAMILLVAGMLAEAGERARRTSLGLVGLGVASLAICGYFLAHTRVPVPGTDLATLLTQHPEDYALSFGHFLDLNARALGLFRFSLILTPITLLGGGVAHWWLRRRGLAQAATLTLAASAFVFLISADRAFVTFSPTLSSEALAAAIAPRLQPGDLVVIHGEYEAGSTLGFYLRRDDLHILEGRSANLWYGSFFPDAPKIFETRASLAAKWGGPRRIYVWEDPTDEKRPVLTEREMGGPIFLVADAGGKRIVSNRR